MNARNVRAVAFAAVIASMACVPPARADDAPTRPDQFAQGWTVASDRADAGAWRLPLDGPQYRTATSPLLRDIAVFDAQGAEVPAAVFAAPAPAAAPAATIALPWFPLPPDDALPGQDVSTISERDSDGRVRRVETRVGDGMRLQQGGVDAWLLDASMAREPLVALRVTWADDAPDFDVGYRVEGSDDLRDWRTLQANARLIDLRRGGDRVHQARIPLSASARYLRLLPLRRGATFPLAGVQAEYAAKAQARDWQWQSLTGPLCRVEGTVEVLFELDGRYPVALVDVGTDSNAAAEWTLESRDDADARWRWRAGPWVGWRLNDGGRWERSAPQPLNGVVRDRYWRLVTRDAATGAPGLRLGWRPESVVFVGQGPGPWTLAAGSGRAQRAQAPIDRMVGALRATRGDDWQPAAAKVGEARELGGARALKPGRGDWTTTVLWVLLFGGALLVAVLAVGALRRNARGAGAGSED